MKAILRNSFIVILALTFSACSSTYIIQPDSFSEVNRKLQNQSVVVSLNSGKTYNGEQIQLSDTSTMFINQMNDSLFVIKTSDINSIYLKHRTGGALEGFLIGASIGAAGGLIGSMNRGSGAEAKNGQLFSGILGGMVGGVTGLAIGIFKGHEYIFKMPQDSTLLHK